MRIAKRLLALVLAATLALSGGVTSVLAADPMVGVKSSGYVDSGELEALKAAVVRADSLLSVLAVSTDGQDVFDTTQWTTLDNYTAFTAAIAGAKTAIAEDPLVRETIIAAQQALDDANTAIGSEMGKRSAARRSGSVAYPNGLGYISIDTVEAGRLSDYATITGLGSGITGARVMFTPGNEDALELYTALSAKSAYTAGQKYSVRLQLDAGKTLSKSMYLVPVMVQFQDGSGIVAEMELHVNATDPAYLKVSKAVFTVADLNNPALDILSTAVVIKSPSGEEITGVVSASKNDYTIENGKWNAATKEYTFQLKPVMAEDGSCDLFDAEILVRFAGKARMTYRPATVSVVLHTSDAKLMEYVEIRPYLLMIDENRADSLEVIRTEKAEQEDIYVYGDVLSVSNFKSEPAGAITLYVEDAPYYHVTAAAKGKATFDATANLNEVEGAFKVNAGSVVWSASGLQLIAPSGVEDEEGWANVNAKSSIDINDLNTYEVAMDADAYNKRGELLDIQSLTFSDAYHSDNALFTISKEPVKGSHGYQFAVKLKNEAEVITSSTFSLRFAVKTAEGTFERSVTIYQIAEGAPTAAYFTKDGKKIEADTLLVDATGTKYGLVVEGFKPAEGNGAKITFDEDYVTIVRGARFYEDMGSNEVVTVRINRTLPENETTIVRPWAEYTLPIVITNSEVKLTVAEGVAVTGSIAGTILQLSSTTAAPDKAALKTAIDAAGMAKKNIYVSVNGSDVLKSSKWVVQAEMDTMNLAIATAQLIYDDAAATPEAILAAISALNSAKSDFIAAQKYGTKSSGGGGGGSGGGSSGGGSTPVANPDKPSAGVNSDGSVNSTDVAQQAADAVKKALAANPKAGKATVLIQNATSISAEALKSIADAVKKAGGTATLYADTTYDGRTIARIYLDPVKAAALGTTIKLGVATNAATVAPVKNHFAKYFQNKMAIASFSQQGTLGMNVEVALRMDMTGIELKNLKVYSFDRATNKYFPIPAKDLRVDANGFVRFTTNRGGDILLVDGALKTK